jgi:transposase
MLTWGGSVRIFVCVQPTDMRRGFDRLAAMALEVTQHHPLSGHLFVFLNRRRDRVKILYWDKSGYCLWYKRLESGQFHLPAPGLEQESMELEMGPLTLMLEGIDLSGARRRKRFSLPGKKNFKKPI